MSTLAWNLTPFVVFRSRTSRQTTTRFESMRGASVGDPAEEVGEDLEPGRPALLGVELHRRQVPRRQGGREAETAVLGLAADHLQVARRGVVAVDEIELAPRRHAPEDRVVPLEADLVPAHVRHLERGVAGEGEAPHLARQEAEAGGGAVLSAGLEDD